MKKTLQMLIAVLGGAVAGAGWKAKNLNKTIKEKQGLSEKHFEMFLLMNQWTKLKQEGKNLKSFFEKKGYTSIAIYGLSYMGERLIEELRGSDIRVSYGIDKSGDGIYLDIETFTPDDDLECVDVIVVTPFYYFDAIKQELEKKMDCPIISIEEILYEV